MDISIDLKTLERYGNAFTADLAKQIYNEEKQRCADATDEELTIRYAALTIMGQVLFQRAKAAGDTDNERRESRTKLEKEKKAELDKAYAPVARPSTERKPETLAERIEREKEEKLQGIRNTAKSMSAAGLFSYDEAYDMLKRKAGIK